MVQKQETITLRRAWSYVEIDPILLLKFKCLKTKQHSSIDLPKTYY